MHWMSLICTHKGSITILRPSFLDSLSSISTRRLDDVLNTNSSRIRITFSFTLIHAMYISHRQNKQNALTNQFCCVSCIQQFYFSCVRRTNWSKSVVMKLFRHRQIVQRNERWIENFTTKCIAKTISFSSAQNKVCESHKQWCTL